MQDLNLAIRVVNLRFSHNSRLLVEDEKTADSGPGCACLSTFTHEEEEVRVIASHTDFD